MKQHTILIVDDSANIRRLLAHSLGRKFIVLTAEDAVSALTLLEKGDRPDLIVVDIAMPGMDGFSLTALIKSNPDYSRIPVVMLTAKDSSEDRQQGLMLGAADYMTKPFNLDDLAERIEHLLC
ncbi:MAG: response regulator [Chlorobium sp.]|jgi:DNA-binding response OmpR family regulator|uniref:response regulator transcription factor n=1 Tax=Chlorobium sp. TaxID=1095 RepID=UPI001D4FE2B2|nr:response regulator [Chlorobium sp.]MBN1279781.1 response regulator [Chlorobiaceae bacterium]MCF8215781.1 response regulator [Chlorobium sp.]MCF8270623.1 response regulator [Chlorobium sp.]MCF8286991.1 response regulator [Chlorobium sp.]MCF8290648.1 response regulator [Chlorobium sp.]